MYVFMHMYECMHTYDMCSYICHLSPSLSLHPDTCLPNYLMYIYIYICICLYIHMHMYVYTHIYLMAAASAADP